MACPALEDTADLPATLSSTIVNGLLRTDIGYRGLVVSDDLEMGAVAPLDPDGTAAVRAVAAGCDLVLYCAKLERAERALDALERALEDAAFGGRVEDAARAVAGTARRWPTNAAVDEVQRTLAALGEF